MTRTYYVSVSKGVPLNDEIVTLCPYILLYTVSHNVGIHGCLQYTLRTQSPKYEKYHKWCNCIGFHKIITSVLPVHYSTFAHTPIQGLNAYIVTI